MYKKDGLTGGHIILLNPPASEYYDATKAQALKALHAYPGGMQIGGGITAENAAEYLEEGASHVIVTSYVFQNGQVRYDRLDRLKKAVGKEHLVLDLSCRRRENSYYIVTNRWQTFTELRLIPEVLEELSGWCDEFLVHGVDVEGKASGTEEDLVRMLAAWNGLPITYAGGIGSMEDLREDNRKWQERVAPLIGGTDILIYPFGADIADWHPYTNDNERFNLLWASGFRYFCNVDSSPYFVQKGNDFMRMGRRNLDGYRMWQDMTVKNHTSDLFNAADIFDPDRPTPVPDYNGG